MAKEQDFIQNFKKNKGNPFKILLGLYKGNFWNFFFSFIFFTLKYSPVIFLPIATANIINAATDSSANSLHIIFLNIGIVASLMVINIPAHYVHTWFYVKVIRNVEKELRNELVIKLQQLSISYHNRIESGRLQSKIIRDVEQIEVLSQQIFNTCLSIIANIVASLVVVATKNITVFLFFIATIPVAVFLIVIFRKRIRKVNADYRKEMEQTSAKVMEMVELIPVTRAHGLENQETKKMTKFLEKISITGLRLDMLQAIFGSISWAIFQLFQILCLGFTAIMTLHNLISIGEVVMYQSYFSTIVANVAGFVTLLPIVSKGLESINSIGEILLSNELENDQTPKTKISDIQDNIIFKDVNFMYEGSDHLQLNNFSFTIPAGKTIAFVGPSGAGKSTILNLIIGFLKAQSGTISIGTLPLSQIDLQSFRKHLAVVPQQSILFTGTLRENITYGSNNITKKQLDEIVSAANLEDLISELPDGLETIITEHGSNLSGGQKQRISIARAFVRNPDLLILDEATSALDSVSEQKIQKAIETLIHNRTTLIVAHRLSTIRNADIIAVIDHGKLVESGNYEELMQKQGAFYKLKELQA